MRTLLLALFVFTTTFSQTDTLSQKTYALHPKLSWDDFKLRRTESETVFSASVSTGFDYSWDYFIEGVEQKFNFEVNTYLYPGSSWVVESQQDSVLLAHEQLHYDISELHARKLRKLISGYALGKNIRRDLRVIYKRVKESHYKMQTLYDKETHHSKIKEQQYMWDKKVDSLLRTYIMYK